MGPGKSPALLHSFLLLLLLLVTTAFALVLAPRRHKRYLTPSKAAYTVVV